MSGENKNKYGFVNRRITKKSKRVVLDKYSKNVLMNNLIYCVQFTAWIR